MSVRVPDSIAQVPDQTLLVTREVHDVKGLMRELGRMIPGLGEAMADPIFNVVVNDEMVLRNQDATPLRDGDRVEIMASFAGG